MIWIFALVACVAFIFFGRDALRESTRHGFLPATPKAPRPEAPALTARWLLDECARLANAGVSWNEIADVVNPGRDAEVAALLARLRAAHDGVVPDILRAIESGSRAALSQNGEAGAFDALTQAVRDSPWTSEARF